MLASSGDDNNNNNNIHKQIYSLFPPTPKPPLQWWELYPWYYWVGLALAIIAFLWKNQPTIWKMFSAIYVSIQQFVTELIRLIPIGYHHLVTKPLQDTYRYGPSFFGGWEGASLTTICARMTYGDEEFWERNFEDCENMYQAKESAFLFVGRPLLFLLLLSFVAWIIKQYMWHNAMRERDRYRDRDMIEFYRAIQVLFRQSNRMIGNIRNQHQHLQQRRRDNPTG